jgi:Do/DeqQ family serine protease
MFNKSYAKILVKIFTISGFMLFNNVAFSTAAILAQPSLAPMLKEVMPSVVNLKVEYPPQPLNNQKEEHSDTTTEQRSSVASGVIIDAENGYIITNNHVVSGAEVVIVNLDDGRTFHATPVGGDPASDIAVIQIKADNLRAIDLGDSDTLEVGDFAVAIGNPYGLEHSVTSGIISALGRTNLGIDSYENFIQTDASINPGNSGGALVNTQGQLIGINSAILGPNPTFGNIGIGLAIPVNMAHSIMLQLVKYGKVQRGLLGIIAQPITAELAPLFGRSNNEGALISYVAPDSLAEKIGLRPGDIILTVNNKKIEDSAQLRNTLGLIAIDSEISMTLVRNQKEQALNFTMTSPDNLASQWEQASPLLAGIELGRINEDIPTHGHVAGLQVYSVTPDSHAAQAQLQPGDIIVSVNHLPVSDLATLKTAIQNSKDQKTMLMHVLRGNGAFFTVLE